MTAVSDQPIAGAYNYAVVALRAEWEWAQLAMVQGGPAESHEFGGGKGGPAGSPDFGGGNGGPAGSPDFGGGNGGPAGSHDFAIGGGTRVAVATGPAAYCPFTI